MRHTLLVSCLFLSACATLTAESDQVISITTEPADAQCKLVNSEGSWEVASTPGTARVRRAFSPLRILCNKAKAGGATATLESFTRNRAYGNILLGGVPAFVDAGTGAGYEYKPADVTLTLTK